MSKESRIPTPLAESLRRLTLLQLQFAELRKAVIDMQSGDSDTQLIGFRTMVDGKRRKALLLALNEGLNVAELVCDNLIENKCIEIAAHRSAVIGKGGDSKP